MKKSLKNLDAVLAVYDNYYIVKETEKSIWVHSKTNGFSCIVCDDISELVGEWGVSIINGKLTLIIHK